MGDLRVVHKTLQRAGRMVRCGPLGRGVGGTWREQDSNLRRRSQPVYSRSPLTAWVSRRTHGSRTTTVSRGSLVTSGTSQSRGREDRLPSDASLKSSEQRCPPHHRTRLRGVAQALSLGEGLELLESVVLDLTNALAGHVEGHAHLLEGLGLTAGESEAHLDDRALPRR